MAALRTALGAAGVAALLAVFGDPALVVLYVLGTGVLAVAALYRLRQSAHWNAREAAPPAPSGARRESRWRIVARESYPSTIGLVVLTAIAAPINASLAALLAGFLTGLGGAALMLGLEQWLWESRAGRTIDYARDRPYGPPRFFSRLRGTPKRRRIAP